MGVASLAIGVASSGAGLLGQMSQGAAVTARNKMQANLDLRALNDEYTQGAHQEIYRNDEAEQKLHANSQAARAASATAAVSAGEAGVQGTSVNALMQEYDAKKGQYAADVEYNRKSENDAIQLQMKGFKDQAQSQLNQLTPPTPPDYFGAIAGVGESAFSAYNRFVYHAPSGVPSSAQIPDRPSEY